MESKPAHLRSRNPQAERERNTRELEATQTTPRDFHGSTGLRAGGNDGLPPVQSPSLLWVIRGKDTRSRKRNRPFSLPCAYWST